MTILLATSTILTGAYTALMVLYRKGWAMQRDYILPPTFDPKVKISVVIPARNEEANIGACLDALTAQIYPSDLLEIIVVDDHSDDNTAAVVAEYASKHVRYVRLADFVLPAEGINAYKKAALATGIALASGELIVTTDADCVAPNAWLKHMAAIYQEQSPDMIVAPVIYTANRTIVQLFQLTDFMSMQGITGAAHALKLGNMSNGANLAFSKRVFDQVGGYEGVMHLASGDDYLLMMKIIQQSPDKIAYLKSVNAAVSTLPQPDWSSFLQQRIRWASKSGKYNDKRLTLILLLVYLFNVTLLVVAVGAFFTPICLWLAVSIYCIKVAAEYYFLLPVARFFHKESVLWYFPFLQPLHIVYIVLAGFLGLVGGYEWKGRKVK